MEQENTKKELKTLKLTQEEIDKVPNLKEIKFKIEKEKFLYSKNVFDKRDNFINSYEYLMYVSSSVDDENIKNRILNYLKQFKNLYHLLYQKNQENIISMFKKKREEKLLNEIVIKNHEIINRLITDVYPIGKIITKYNLDEGIGTASS